MPPSIGKGIYTCDTDASLNDISSNDESDDGGLSSGAIAGIAVGVVALLAIIGLLVAGWAWLRLRRKRKAERANEEHGVPAMIEKDGPDREASRALKAERNRTKELPPSPPYSATSGKETEMGRPLSGSFPGPEGRHEVQTGVPAAIELPSYDER